MRRMTALFTIIGIALVVFVFTAVLMMAHGVEKTMTATGSKENVIVVRKGSNNEISSIVTGDAQNIIRTLPGVAHNVDGSPIISSEPVVVINLSYASGGMSNVTVRGVSPGSEKLRPQLHIIEGRMFNPSLRELIVGEPISKKFNGAQIGSTIKFANNEWKIVGIFTSNGGGFESEIHGNSTQLQDAFNRGNSASSVTLKLEHPEDYDKFKQLFQTDIRLQQFEPEIEQTYYSKQSEMLAGFIKIIGIFITVIFSIGATVGAMITMYGAVANRTIEIGTMRALGFNRRSILTVFLAESILIAFTGAVIGILIASVLQFFKISTLNYSSFSEIAFSFALSPSIIISSLIFGVAMGFLGGFLPSARAARMNIVTALRSA